MMVRKWSNIQFIEYLCNLILLIFTITAGCESPKKEQELISAARDLSRMEKDSLQFKLEIDDVKFENRSILNISKDQVLKYFGEPKESNNFEMDLVPKRIGESLKYDSLEVSFEDNDSINKSLFYFSFKSKLINFSPKSLTIGSDIQNIKIYVSDIEWKKSLETGLFTVWLYDNEQPQDCFLSIISSNGKITEVSLNKMYY